MKKVIFLATLTFASASVFGMDSVPDTGSERKRIQNSEVAPNQKKAIMEKEFSELMEAVKSNKLKKVKKIWNAHVDKSAVLNLLIERNNYKKGDKKMPHDQIDEHHEKIFQNSTKLVNLSEKRSSPLLMAAQKVFSPSL